MAFWAAQKSEKSSLGAPRARHVAPGICRVGGGVGDFGARWPQGRPRARGQGLKETRKQETKKVIKSGIVFDHDDPKLLRKQFMKLRMLITGLKVIPSLDQDQQVKHIIWQEVKKVID